MTSTGSTARMSRSMNAALEKFARYVAAASPSTSSPPRIVMPAAASPALVPPHPQKKSHTSTSREPQTAGVRGATAVGEPDRPSACVELTLLATGLLGHDLTSRQSPRHRRAAASCAACIKRIWTHFGDRTGRSCGSAPTGRLCIKPFRQVAAQRRLVPGLARSFSPTTAGTSSADWSAAVSSPAWHLRHASVAPLVPAAWSYRHNLTAADALYVALAEQLGASLLTDDHRLAQAPTFPSHVTVLRLPVSL